MNGQSSPPASFPMHKLNKNTEAGGILASHFLNAPDDPALLSSGSEHTP